MGSTETSKPILNVVKVEYFEIDTGELEKFVKKVYGIKEYEFAAVQESPNDVSYTFHVSGQIDKWDNEIAQKIREGIDVPMWCNSVLLECLCVDGYILKGEYIIHVSW